MKTDRYNLLVTLCVWALRIAMIVLAAAIPICCSISSSILNRLAGVNIENPQFYYLYQLIYSEVILGYLLSMFINFKHKEIFVEQNAGYFKHLGRAIILKDFIYIPIDIIFNHTFTIQFNIYAWMLGLIMFLFARLLLHGIRISKEQEYTV